MNLTNYRTDSIAISCQGLAIGELIADIETDGFNPQKST